MIRVLAKSDAAAIYQLLLTIFGSDWSWNEKSIVESFVSPYYFYYGIFDNEQLVGVAQFKLLFESAELLNLGVLATKRQQGWGQQLLQWALSDLRKRGMTDCVLEVRASNRPAIHLYTKNHFARIAERPNYYQNNQETALIYQRKDNRNDKDISN